MDRGKIETHCPFDTLFTKNVPHILEDIFLSLDFESYTECLEVNKTWNRMLTSQSFKKKAQLEFPDLQKELWLASMWGKDEKVRRIISSGMVDVNLVGGFNDSTPLCEAACEGRKEVVKLLLHAGADPNKADRHGRTPLYWTAMSGHIDVVDVLLHGGADPNMTNWDGFTPLHMAAWKGHKNVAISLLKRGAKHDKADFLGKTPLSVALECGKEDTYRIISKYYPIESWMSYKEATKKLVYEHVPPPTQPVGRDFV